jgi:predicted DCC family thiol-disulfide oxidoreductase YuxK
LLQPPHTLALYEVEALNLPPKVNSNDRVVLYDGVCKLCNGWSKFLLKHDKDEAFKLCSVQSPEGQDILKWFGMPTSEFETMLLVEGNTAYYNSDAFLNIVKDLPKPWRFLRALRILPKNFRNWFYDRIALNRYLLFGKYDQCVVPSKSDFHRFLDHG